MSKFNAFHLIPQTTTRFSQTPIKRAIKLIMVGMIVGVGISTMTACQSISANDSFANPNNAEALTQSQIAHNRQPKATPIMARSGYLADIKANDDAHKKVFDTLNDTSDAVAKQRFLTALNAHLSGKHTAVSQTRLQSEPYLQDSDPNYVIDKDAASLLYSLAAWVAQMMGDRYDDGDEDSEPAYRTYDDMPDDDELWLDYRDETQGRLPYPEYNITWGEAFDDDRIQAYEEAMEGSVWEMDSCVIRYSTELDDLVSENDTLTGDDEQVIQARQDFEACMQTIKEDYPKTEDIEGYPRIYQADQMACVVRYEGWLDELLNRRTDEEIIYNEYDSIYYNYEVCSDRVFNMAEMNPEAYLNTEISESDLQSYVNKVECAEVMLADYDQLASEGVTYGNDPEAFVEGLAEFDNCKAEGVNSAYGLDEFDIEENEDAIEDNDNDNVDLEGSDSEITDSATEETNSDLENDEAVKDEEIEETEERNEYQQLLDDVYAFLHRTPAQVESVNHYYSRHITLDTLRTFDASQKQLDMVLSYTVQAPTFYSSMQLPVAMNFNDASVTLDPNALMPIMAMVSDDVPLPEDMTSNTVQFHLPETLTDELPSDVVFDALVSSLIEGYAGLDAGYFSNVDVKTDAFAKQVGANRAVKLYLGTKPSGELLGRIVKLMEQKLSAYAKANPERFADDSEVLEAINTWADINQK